VEVDETVLGGEGVKGEMKTQDIDLTLSFKPTEVKEEQSIAAGVVTLHNESSASQPLVATTRLLTSEGVIPIKRPNNSTSWWHGSSYALC